MTAGNGDDVEFRIARRPHHCARSAPTGAVVKLTVTKTTVNIAITAAPVNARTLSPPAPLSDDDEAGGQTRPPANLTGVLRG